MRIARGRIAAVACELRALPGEDVLDARGGALLPGLHDHHVHLRAVAAALGSVQVGPPLTSTEFADRLARAVPVDGWVRAVGYHESVAGPLDRWRLDAIVGDRPVRVQHRSGALWVLNSAGLAAVGSADPSGRLWRQDRWLSSRVPRVPASLADVGRLGLSYGVTGFTDATPDASQADVDGFSVLPQRVHAMAPVGVVGGGRVSLGPVKVMLDDSTLPAVGELSSLFSFVHSAGRVVAVHCVTHVQLVATLAALGEAGSVAGDRIEHAALVPSELIPVLRSLGVVVVTQPGFVAGRGDQYLSDVESRDLVDLWRLASLLSGGVAVGGGTDAPFGSFDPWVAVASAVSRRSGGGVVVGGSERVSGEVALGLFLGGPLSPARPRSVSVGAVADLCLLKVSLAEALADPCSSLVRATLVAGEVMYSA